jgi:hypothetical protein
MVWQHEILTYLCLYYMLAFTNCRLWQDACAPRRPSCSSSTAPPAGVGVAMKRMLILLGLLGAVILVVGDGPRPVSAQCIFPCCACVIEMNCTTPVATAGTCSYLRQNPTGYCFYHCIDSEYCTTVTCNCSITSGTQYGSGTFKTDSTYGQGDCPSNPSPDSLTFY